jgi:hypothetical protein
MGWIGLGSWQNITRPIGLWVDKSKLELLSRNHKTKPTHPKPRVVWVGLEIHNL